MAEATHMNGDDAIREIWNQRHAYLLNTSPPMRLPLQVIIGREVHRSIRRDVGEDNPNSVALGNDTVLGIPVKVDEARPYRIEVGVYTVD